MPKQSSTSGGAPARLAVLASGEGTTLQSLIDSIDAGQLEAQVAVVVCNNRGSGALAKAAAAGIPFAHLSAVTHPEAAALDAAIRSVLEQHGVEIVVLAGYMKKIGPQTLARFSGRIINTHPSLLPRHGGKGMHGRHVHEAVLAGGDAHTGVSVHLVDAEYDTGRVLAHSRIPVPPQATVEMLEREVRTLERQFLCTTLQRIARGEIALTR
jgi:phosphoribosylglycinamide formyltransferase 1